MNRELKFRIWRFCHSENKYKFYYTSNPQIVANSGATLVFPTDGNLEYVDDSIKECDEVIQQFTGLVDKNGKEIYEGDILRINYDIGGLFGQNDVEVYYDEEYACFSFNRVVTYSPLEEFDIKESEVIGNIHENSELLNS